MSKVVGFLGAVLVLILGVVLPMTLDPSPVVLAVLWTAAGAVLLAWLFFVATPVGRRLVKQSQRPAEPGFSIYIGGDNTGPINMGTAPAAPPPAPVRGPDRLVDLVPSRGPTLVTGETFVGRHFTGPALMVPMDCQFYDCTWGGDPQTSLVWEIPPNWRRIIGAVGFDECVFHHCTFENIAIAAPSNVADVVRRALTPPEDHLPG